MSILEDDTWDGCLFDLMALGYGIIVTATAVIVAFAYDIWWTITATEKNWHEWIGVVVASVVILIELLGVVAALKSSASLLSIAKPLHTLVIIGVILSFIAQIILCAVRKEWVMPYIVIYTILHIIAGLVGLWGRNVYASALTRRDNDLSIWERSAVTGDDKAAAKRREQTERDRARALATKGTIPPPAPKRASLNPGSRPAAAAAAVGAGAAGAGGAGSPGAAGRPAGPAARAAPPEAHAEDEEDDEEEEDEEEDEEEEEEDADVTLDINDSSESKQ